MDTLSWIILSKPHLYGQYNSTYLSQLFDNEPDFAGFLWEDIMLAFGQLVKENILSPIQDEPKNFFLSPKGELALVAEEKRRQREFKKEAYDLLMAESVIQANKSSLETNQFMIVNAIRQNRLTKMNIWVTLTAVLVSLAALVNSFRDSNYNRYKDEQN